ncbi:hypothetical protein P3815_25240 [Pseudomonas aeruginosa]|nr:hypothetical protein [Pseudomonas aeruginosa]
MKYEEVLLIGGPHDGRRMSVMEGVPTIQMGVPMGAPAVAGDFSAKPVAKIIDSPTYHRHPIHSSTGFVGAVYVVDGVDPMAALIEGYRKP